MKNLVLCLVLILSLFSCSSDENYSDSKTNLIIQSRDNGEHLCALRYYIVNVDFPNNPTYPVYQLITDKSCTSPSCNLFWADQYDAVCNSCSSCAQCQPQVATFYNFKCNLNPNYSSFTVEFGVENRTHDPCASHLDEATIIYRIYSAPTNADVGCPYPTSSYVEETLHTTVSANAAATYELFGTCGCQIRKI